MYGPVVALGNPTDRIQPYGAARGYFQGVEWKQAVGDLVSGAKAIVVCMNDTDNIWWEVEQIVNEKGIHKTLFVFRPRHELKEKRAIIHRLAEEIPQLREFALPSHQPTNEQFISSILGFFFDNEGNLQIGVSSSFRHLAYVLMSRWFVRSANKETPEQAVA